MHLHHLQLIDFKNYEKAELDFPAQITCLLGLNGSGKTNLLDAIYYLSATRSSSGASDRQCIRNGAEYFFIKGNFEIRGKRHEVTCQVQHGTKKIFREDGRDYPKLSGHIGRYPVVLISPVDADLVRDGSETRRKFFDNLISQVDPTYLGWLVTYNHVLKQRNRLLSLFAERNFQDYDLLRSYDEQLITYGSPIASRRDAFIREFEPLFNNAFEFVTDRSEKARLIYRSTVVNTDYRLVLTQSLPKDFALQRTTEGVHRDDFEFRFAHGELKKLGSQGQQKSFLVAIKLAQLELLRLHTGFYPILLLDDIFDKLDDQRISRLLDKVSGKSGGQLFITDAGPDRTPELLRKLRIECDIFSVVKGTVSRL